MYKTNDLFLEESRTKFPQIDVLSEYTSSKNKMDFYCNTHDYFFTKTAHQFINSACGCNLCARDSISKSKIKSPEQYRKEFESKWDDLILLDDYTKSVNDVRVQCKRCGTIFSSNAGDLLLGHGCNVCARKDVGLSRVFSHEHFLELVEENNIYYRQFDIISNYTGCENKVMCLCLHCGHTWEKKAISIYRKGHSAGCPICNMPIGECLTYNFLADNQVDFEIQKKFDGLVGVNNGLLSYDFYIDKLKMLIEVNGSQHYYAKEKFGGEQAFIKQVEHDKRKREYAEANGYSLIEIPYMGKRHKKRMFEILQTICNTYHGRK